MLKNNRFSWDKDGERLERTQLLSHNIDDYSAELGVVGDNLTLSQTAGADWMSAVTTATIEKGEAMEATEELNKALKEAHTYYVDAKELLLAIIYQISKPDQIVTEYDIVGDAPWDYKNLSIRIKNLLDTDKLLKAESDPRVLNDTIIANLTTHLDTITPLWHESEIEHRESAEYRAVKNDLFDQHSNLLSFVYGAAKLTWGPDNPKLRDLGFVPSSEIWTENKPPHPKNFAYDDVAKQFNWDAVADVDNYEIDYRLTGASGNWTQLYKGADTSTASKPPDPGEYDFRIRSWAGDDSGAWSGVIVVNFSGGALAAPENFKFDDKKQIFSWDKVKDADRYQLEYSRDGGQTWTNKYDGAEPKFDASHMDSGKWLFRVRALNATETSPWGITLEVWLGMPKVPGNLRWHPEEYHGDMFAKIEWDAAASADEYELENITEGFVFNTGSSTFKFEDIMDLPGEHEYRVRGKNDYGFSEWSPVLTFWLGVPAIPLNIGWRFVEHLSEQWWEIYWDSAAGAVNYDLSYINAGHQDYYGPNTRSGPIDPKPEPGEHRFKVRAENDYGFGDWSEILVIVVE